MLGHRVTIGNIEVAWEGLAPILRLHDLALYPIDVSGKGPPIRLAHAEIALDPLETARKGTLRSRKFRVVGAALTLTRNPEGKIVLAGFGSLLGDKPMGTTPRRTPGMGTWSAIAFAQNELELLGTEIRWFNRSNPTPPISIGKINTVIRKENDRHHIQAQMSSGREDEQPLMLQAELTGSFTNADWSARVELEAERLNLPYAASLVHLFRPLVGPLKRTIKGTAAIKINASIGPDGLRHLDGAVSALRPSFRFRQEGPPADFAVWDPVSSSPRSLEFERIDFEGTVRSDNNGWLAQTRQLKIVSRQGVWPTGNIAVRVTEESNTAERVELRADRLSLQHAQGLLNTAFANSFLKRALQTTRPKGEIRDVTATIGLQNGTMKVRHFAGEIVNLQTSGDQMIPGLNGVHGRIEASAEGGRFTISDGSSALTIPAFYSSPQRVITAQGSFAWTLGRKGGIAWADGVKIQGEGVEIALDGAGLWQADVGSPFVAGVMKLGPTDISANANVLLIKKLPAPFRNWMKKAVIGGTLESLEISTRGYLDKSPFSTGHEEFSLTAKARGFNFDYASGWPQAAGVDTDIHLRDRRFQAKITQAKVFDAHSKSFLITIPDLTARPLTLDIQGVVEANTQDGLRFVRESALSSTLGHEISTLSSTGRCKIELEMALEIPTGHTKHLAGKVTMFNNQLLTAAGLALEEINGELHFSREGLRLTDVEALYLDTPVTLVTTTTAEPNVTAIDMRGTADGPFLERLAESLGFSAHPTFREAISGRTPWRASLSIPNRGGKSPQALRVRTPLTGMAVNLPGSLHKQASETRPFDLMLTYNDSSARRLEFSYGDVWKGAFALARRGRGWRTERGHVRLGGELAVVPAVPGIVIDGRLPSIDLNSWNQALTGANSFTDTSLDLVGQIRSVTLTLDSLHAFEQTLAVDKVRALRRQDSWDIQIAGEQIAGQISLPTNGNTQHAPITVRLDRLLTGPRGSLKRYTGTPPQKLAPMDVEIASLHIDQLDLGAIRFRTQPIATGLRIADLRIANEAFAIGGDGAWAYQDELHTTKLKLNLRADRLGKLLAALGHTDTLIEGGATDIAVDADWTGIPLDFDLGIVRGSIHARSKKGQLIDIQPGLPGRAFGLLSLAALPRLLRMDFSHVFGEGFSFDAIEGNFHLEGGNAYTNSLYMIGPSARVDLAGRAGLINRDYDQLVTVTPRLTSSIPFAPLWLAEKMLHTNIFNRVFSTQYLLTGSWEKPIVTRIDPPTEEQDN